MIRILACAATALAFSCSLSADLDAQARKTKKTSGPTWVDGVSYTTDWKTAIKAVQQSGKMLFIYNGWKGSGIWAPCDQLKGAVRDLLNATQKGKGKKGKGKKGKGKNNKHRLTAEAMREKFVFLNIYCKSVKDERDPRGPEGPYRFTDRSVPVVVIKKFDGTTLKQQLGWGGGIDQLARIVDKAVKENGPVAPPKALRPLLKSFAKAKQLLKRKQIRGAIRELQKIEKAAQNKKKFKDGLPEVALKAQTELGRLKKQGLADLTVIQIGIAKGSLDARSGKSALNRLLAKYGGIGEIKTKVRAELKKQK